MNLKKIRKEKGFTIPQLADALGVSLDELCRNKAED